jgi:hypothetical protein
MKKALFSAILCVLLTAVTAMAGGYNYGRYDYRSTSNPYGEGSRYHQHGVGNQYSPYGGYYGNQSWRNPYAEDAPRVYGSGGEYRGRWSSNRYDPDSTSSPYGHYGSPYSPYGRRGYYERPVYVYPAR